MPKSKKEISDSFEKTSRKTQRSRAIAKAVLIAAAIEAPLLALVFWFMPVDVTDASGQTHTVYSYSAAVYSYSAAAQDHKIKMEFLLPELLAIVLCAEKLATEEQSSDK